MADDRDRYSDDEDKVISLDEVRQTRGMRLATKEENRKKGHSDEYLDRHLREEIKAHASFRRTMALCLALILIVVILVYVGIRLTLKYNDIVMVDSKSTGEMGVFTSLPYADGVIKYNNDGMSYFDRDGMQKWTKTYEMRKPKPSVCGDYIVMADIGYNNLVICNRDGFQGSAYSPLPISTVSISREGRVAAVVEDDMANRILFFDKTGAKSDSNFQTLMNKTGYPMSAALSPDGKMLMVSYVYMEQGMMNNKLIFYDFHDSQVGANQTVGGFQKYGDTLFARVAFLEDNKRAVAFGDGRIVFFTLKNRVKPEETADVKISDTIERVFYDEEGVYVVTSQPENNSWLVTCYAKDGTARYAYRSTFLPDYVGMKNGCLYFHDSSTLVVYGKVLGKMKLRFHGNFKANVRTVVNLGKDNSFLILTDTQLMRVKLKN
ncbi:MAG: hypothetical protein J6T47_00330 [Lachnospiraceae bacterium]|nr:hypothetical protein [Lachnospiraceae bacterium]